VATASSSWRIVVFPTPGTPATMIVACRLGLSLSQEAFGSRVYLGNSFFYENFIVLLYNAYGEQDSCSCAEGAEEVCTGSYYSDCDSAYHCDCGDVPVKDLSNG